MNYYSDTPAAGEPKREREDRKFFADFQRDTARWNLEREDRKFFQLITGGQISERALMSNGHVHRRARTASIDALGDEFQRHPGRQYLWITLTWDTAVTWERAPHIDLVSLRNIAQAHLRRCGLDGFGVIEIDAWKNLTGEPGRRIVPHVHFVGWPADGAATDVKNLEEKLCARRALSNSLGAKPVVIKEITCSSSDFARIGSYMFKRPAYAKNRLRKRGKDGSVLFQTVHSKGSAARLVEIFSHVEVGDVIFSMGGGRTIANHIRGQIRHEIRVRPGAKSAPTRDLVTRHWRRVRLRNGSSEFRDCVIITRSDQRTRKNADSLC